MTGLFGFSILSPSRSRSGGSSTRAEHGRSQEERGSSKRRPRQPISSAQDSTGNQSDTGPPRMYVTFGGYVKPQEAPSYGNGHPVF
eukprot:205424-Pelagomonas_calceolata.AAC.4